MEDWVDRINFQSSLGAKQLFVDNKKPSNARPITRSLFAFFKKLFIKGGILQGKNGFKVAITTMFATYIKYIKLNDLHKNNKN